MRILFFFFILILTIACSSKKQHVELESDVFISSFDTGMDATGRSVLKEKEKSIYFSKDFWNYFIRTHPKTCSIVFIMPLYDTNNNYVSLPDTSYSFYNLTVMSSFYFKDLLADGATGQEREKQVGSFFIVADDTTGTAAKVKRVEQNSRDYKITAEVEKEFERLKAILTLQDTSEHYVIVFKKIFADKIYKQYE